MCTARNGSAETARRERRCGLAPKKPRGPPVLLSSLLIRETSGTARGLNDAVFLADFGEGFEGAVELGAFVGGHVAGAQHGALGRDAGRDERVGVDAVLFEQ